MIVLHITAQGKIQAAIKSTWTDVQVISSLPCMISAPAAVLLACEQLAGCISCRSYLLAIDALASSAVASCEVTALAHELQVANTTMLVSLSDSIEKMGCTAAEALPPGNSCCQPQLLSNPMNHPPNM
jgi:hypothetical protein